MNILHSIGAAIASVGIFIGGLFGYTPETVQAPVQEPIQEELGRAVDAVGARTYTLAGSGISSSATTITLSSFTAPVTGAPLTMANFGQGVNAKGYATLEQGNPQRQEFISFTGVTQNADGTATLTGVSRGLLPFSPYTASSTYAVPHNGGSSLVISNAPGFYDAIYSYIDNATTSGAVDAATTIKGLVEVASGLEAASSTQIGGGNTTAPLALTTLISTSTAPSSGNVIPVTRSDGNLDLGFLPGILDIQVYTSTTTTHTWTKPTNASVVEVILIGGGGGGGSGGSEATAGSASGGGAGAGGGYFIGKFSASTFGATTSVTVGAGGTGGVGVLGDSAGNAGSVGASSTFAGYVTAPGGLPGGAGQNGVSVGAGANSSESVSFVFSTTPGTNCGSGGSGANASDGQSAQNCRVPVPTGGGGGGGTDGTTNRSGGTGGSLSGLMTLTGGTAGPIQSPGGNGTSATSTNPVGGTGGGGGGTGINGNSAGNGGDGGRYGGGGGGGAGSEGATSGSGGRGGDGIVVVITYR